MVGDGVSKKMAESNFVKCGKSNDAFRFIIFSSGSKNVFKYVRHDNQNSKNKRWEIGSEKGGGVKIF